MKTQTMMDRIRLIGTALVTPFLVGGAMYGVWGLIDRIINWQTEAAGGLLNEAMQVSQILCGVAAVALALMVTASLWRRCFPRRRAWESGAAKLPNPFTTSGKYAAWKFRRPSRRQALFGTLRIKKKVRSALSRPKPEGP